MPRKLTCTIILTVLWWAGTGPVAANEVDALPDIRLHTILEAPVEAVKREVADAQRLEGWFAKRVQAWAPEAEKSFGLILFDGEEVSGTFGGLPRREADVLAMQWSEEGATMLRIQVRGLDGHLTMLSIVQTDWGAATAERKKRHAHTKARWRHALLRLQMRYPEPLVETWRRRPRDVEGEYVERNLLVNGHFEIETPGRFEGVGWGWEINRGDAAPKVHAVDEKVFHTGRFAQRIAHPPDWSNYAIQQFTPEAPGLIVPGKRYVLSGYVKSEGIRNPAGWYTLGLWAARIHGTPIGEPLKNDRILNDEGKPLLNHDWRRIEITGTAPPGASRGIVILSGHWDEAGTVWYDDLRLWPDMPAPTTVGK